MFLLNKFLLDKHQCVLHYGIEWSGACRYELGQSVILAGVEGVSYAPF